MTAVANTGNTGKVSGMGGGGTSAPQNAPAVTASVAAPDPAAAGAKKLNWREARAGYKIVHIGVGNANKALMTALEALAAKLQCKPNALIWEGIKRVVDAPPSVAPAGSVTSQGTTAGYWVVPEIDANGRGTRIRVVHVSSRAAVRGRQFYHYAVGDVKHQGRSARQALRAAQYDTKLLGIKGPAADIQVEEFDTYRKTGGPEITEVGKALPEGLTTPLPSDTPMTVRGS